MKKLFRTLTTLALCCIMIVTCCFTLVGCRNDDEDDKYQVNKNLDTSKEVVLRIATSKATWVEMDYVISKFEEIYPNCTVKVECVEDYNVNLVTRLSTTEEKIDIFRTINIQDGVAWLDCALNLISEESKQILDLSDCNEGLVKNFEYTSAPNIQYAVPYGGEMRGMYVNVTLLTKLGLSVPTNKAEFLNCCKVLAENDYLPLQSHYGTLGQQLLYPSICNNIVNGGNYEQAYNDVKNIVPNLSERFRTEYAFLYDLVQEGYYNPKESEKLGYTFSGNEGKAFDFLNIIKKTAETYEKQDDEGKIAFLIDTQGFKTYLDDAKESYHSEIEYQFITAPIGEDGGYAYLSPSDGLAINKNSDNTDWALEFLNFFFYSPTSTEFANMSNKISNTKDALLKYDADADHISTVGQVTFNYPFYKTVTTLLMGGYSAGYLEVNANYRAVYTEETYYRKVLGDYEVADAAYIEENPTKTFYRLDGSDYVVSNAEYIEANPDTTYYYKATDYYVPVDDTYITDNPTEKIYRAEVPMIGISRMTDKKYMTDNGDGTYDIKFTLEEYLDRLEIEFQKAKATRDGAPE